MLLPRLSRVSWCFCVGLFALAACGKDDPTSPDAVASVVIGSASSPMERTTTQQLTVSTLDANGTALTGRTVTWSSSDNAIATIDASTGVVTATGRGTATITATSEGKTDNITIGVVILYRSITTGDGFSCDLGSIGIATCWGSNGGQDGRLGNGPLDNASLADSPVPVTVLGNLRFTMVSSGLRHSCGITAAGAAYCWGGNGSGQLGAPSVPSWAHQPVPVAGGHAFKFISAGFDHSCGLTLAGAAYCWGENGSGQLGSGNQTDATSPVAVTGGFTFASISAGQSQGANTTTCAVAMDGKGYCWGSDTYGGVGDGGTVSFSSTDIRTAPTLIASATTFSAISVGTLHVCGVLTTGVGVCWGENSSSRLGNASTVSASSTPVPVGGSQTFLNIDTGNHNSCGVTTAFALYCWGANTNGESGTADAVGQIAEIPALAATGEWSEVSAGATSIHTCAISRDRLSVKCFGMNDEGQLGNGTTTGMNVANATPVPVTGQQP